MGMYRTWYRKTKIYQEPNNEIDWIEYYNEENFSFGRWWFHWGSHG